MKLEVTKDRLSSTAGLQDIVNSGFLKGVSFFWRWVKADWTFHWPISNSKFETVELAEFWLHIWNEYEYTVLSERAINVSLSSTTTYLCKSWVFCSDF